MIYWFTGQPAHGKTTLGSKLKRYLKNNDVKKNTFMVDGDELREILQNKDYTENGRRTNMKVAQGIASYLHHQNFNVVVCLVSPYRDLRDEFKEQMGKEIKEIYINCKVLRSRENFRVANYQAPRQNYINIDTSNATIDESFVELLHKLNLKL
jgi:adenylylsulfate kinase-like enzyme|tara:strand:+ start:3531 stop:3989 length:459 start_codon:yes stop_codon:yes gene_type:complete